MEECYDCGEILTKGGRCPNCSFYEDDYDDDQIFADPGGRSALRAVTPNNPRNLPCPTCGRENMLTPADQRLGYQCDICADQAEGYF